ncbi:hypothetical protein ACFUTX_01425 [Microbacterium sp. NPDC057407]|uniref:hypothetical protein n=1 Tax=Microbacterium sp. NPDC057407 TaxID=3346120 RepID=UPI00366B718F
MNPLLPSATDVALASLVVLNTVLVVVALVALLRAKDKRRWLSTLLLIVLVPIAGPIVALVATRPASAGSSRRAASPS